MIMVKEYSQVRPFEMDNDIIANERDKIRYQARQRDFKEVSILLLDLFLRAQGFMSISSMHNSSRRTS